jgi:hypothetical protein
MEVHYEEISLVHLKKDGTVYNRSNSNVTLKEATFVDTQHRILPNAANPNTVNYPDIRTYLQLEAAAGFAPVQVAQYFVVTYKP